MRALSLVAIISETPTKREVITITHYDGRLLAMRLQELHEMKKTGQLIVNYSQGQPITAQWLEKSFDTQS